MKKLIIPASELVLNNDGSVYHLRLLPEDISDTIIFVGDPERVPEVSKYFDKIELQKQKREFVTHTGYVGSNRLSVISTGIGTDNIDIVMNELDALVNIDLKTREVKQQLSQLRIIRIGTAGALQADIETGSVLVSSHGLGLDSLMQFYDYQQNEETISLLNTITKQLDMGVIPYLFEAPGNLLQQFGQQFMQGITATCSGFYAPQGRMLRAQAKYANLAECLSKIELSQYRIANFEMETAGIYGMAAVFGHEAVSVNAILANRITNEFNDNPALVIEQTIQQVLEILNKK